VPEPLPVPDPDLSRTLVTELLDDMYGAFLDRDWDRFDAHLTQDVTAWESHLPQMMRGLEGLRAFRAERGEPAALAGLSVDLLDLDVWGDVAVARYVLTARGADPQAQPQLTRVTEVLRWDGAAWRIARRHAEAR